MRIWGPGRRSRLVTIAAGKNFSRSVLSAARSATGAAHHGRWCLSQLPSVDCHSMLHPCSGSHRSAGSCCWRYLAECGGLFETQVRIERPSDSGNLMEQGPYDQRCRSEVWTCEDTRPLSSRNDVLVFQTAPLDKDVELTGSLIVKLWGVVVRWWAVVGWMFPPSVGTGCRGSNS